MRDASQPLRVLLVDADEEARASLAGGLIAGGAQVVECATGRGARQVWETGGFDRLIVAWTVADGTAVSLLASLPGALGIPTIVTATMALPAIDVERLRSMCQFAGVMYYPTPADTVVDWALDEGLDVRACGVAAEPTAIATQMAALRDRFERGLPARIEGLRSLVEHYVVDPHDGAADAAAASAHALRGSAGTYGHGEIAQACSELESALRARGDLPRVSVLLATLTALCPVSSGE